MLTNVPPTSKANAQQQWNGMNNQEHVEKFECTRFYSRAELKKTCSAPTPRGGGGAISCMGSVPRCRAIERSDSNVMPTMRHCDCYSRPSYPAAGAQSHRLLAYHDISSPSPSRSNHAVIHMLLVSKIPLDPQHIRQRREPWRPVPLGARQEAVAFSGGLGVP